MSSDFSEKNEKINELIEEYDKLLDQRNEIQEAIRKVREKLIPEMRDHFKVSEGGGSMIKAKNWYYVTYRYKNKFTLSLNKGGDGKERLTFYRYQE